eukprot:630683-Amphidinium_carterae.1
MSTEELSVRDVRQRPSHSELLFQDQEGILYPQELANPVCFRQFASALASPHVRHHSFVWLGGNVCQQLAAFAMV